MGESWQFNAFIIKRKSCQASNVRSLSTSLYGIYGGVFLSSGRTISEKDIVINEGFTLKAALRILGYTGTADVRISTGEYFINVTLPAVDWMGGAIQIRRNKEDKVNGPIFVMNMNYETREFYIEGMYI